MDPRLKTIAENLDSWKLGLDDSFQFHCTACGKCCIDREDILLTPRDLYNASKALNMVPAEFVNTYCECYIGQDSRIPIVRLKPRGSIKRCPLLTAEGSQVLDPQRKAGSLRPVPARPRHVLRERLVQS